VRLQVDGSVGSSGVGVKGCANAGLDRKIQVSVLIAIQIQIDFVADRPAQSLSLVQNQRCKSFSSPANLPRLPNHRLGGLRRSAATVHRRPWWPLTAGNQRSIGLTRHNSKRLVLRRRPVVCFIAAERVAHFASLILAVLKLKEQAGWSNSRPKSKAQFFLIGYFSLVP